MRYCVVILLFLPLSVFAQKTLIERCHSFPEDAPINCLYAEGERIWLGTSEGLYMYSYTTNRKNILEDMDVISITRGGKGRMWISLRDGTIMSTDRQKQFSIKKEGFAPYVTQMLGLGEQLWIATAEKGIYVWNTSEMKLVKHLCTENKNILSNTMNGIVLKDENTILAYTDKGLVHIEEMKVKGIHTKQNITAATIYNEVLYGMDDDYRAWEWIWEGLRAWDKLPKGLAIAEGLVRDITFDDEGRLYTASNILSRYNFDTKKLEVFGPEDGFVHDKSLCLVTDGNGDVWVGTSKNGLYRFKVLEEDSTALVVPTEPIVKEDTETAPILPELDATSLEAGTTLAINQLYFQADSTNFDVSSVAALEEIYSFLVKNPRIQVEIGGHTNNLPPTYYCDQLSTDRAKSVAEYLYQKGIPKTQVSYKGYGKRKPIASNRTPEGRKKNQRVEIKVLSIK